MEAKTKTEYWDLFLIYNGKMLQEQKCFIFKTYLTSQWAVYKERFFWDRSGLAVNTSWYPRSACPNVWPETEVCGHHGTEKKSNSIFLVLISSVSNLTTLYKLSVPWTTWPSE